jgi:hypothetical protein
MSGNPIANAQGDNLLYGGSVDPRVNEVQMPANAVYIYAVVLVVYLLNKPEVGLLTLTP